MSTRASAETEVDRILRQHHGVLVRTKKHECWKFPDGRMFVRACTPSDIHAQDNQLRDLKRMLGLNGTRGQVGERRERICKPGRESAPRITPSANTAMLEALRKVGLTEEALNAKIATLSIELRDSRRANARKKRALAQMDLHVRRCLGCRISRAFWRFIDRCIAAIQ